MHRRLHLLVDFDETLTVHDTIGILAHTFYRHLSPPPSTPWSAITSAYGSDHAALVAQFPPASTRTSIAAELRFLDSLRPVEERSIRRIEQARIFNGLPISLVSEEAGCTVRLRPGAGDLLAHGKEWGRVDVVSVNWSSVWIRGALGEGALGVGVRCNELLVDGSGGDGGGITNGGLSRPGVWTAGDKVGVVEELVREERGRLGLGQTLVVYLGDSVTDLGCLLSADVGVVLGDRLDGTCGRVGVEVVKGLQDVGSGIGESEARRRLYKVERLEEVLEWMEGLGGLKK
jgi:hypothetical protein